MVLLVDRVGETLRSRKRGAGKRGCETTWSTSRNRAKSRRETEVLNLAHGTVRMPETHAADVWLSVVT